MQIFLSLVGVIAFVMSLGAMLLGQSAVHEILAAVYMLIAVVSFIGITLCNKLDALGKILVVSKDPKTRPADQPKAVIVG